MILYIIAWSPSFTQEIDSAFYRQKEDMLLLLHSKITESSLKNKLKAEENFRDSLVEILQHPESFYYTFPGLTNIGRISSDDGLLNIFSWNIPQTGGFNTYYAILQYAHKRSKKVYVYPLRETHNTLSKSTQDISFPEAWVGSLYYEIVTTKYKGQVFYTLLGFHFNNILSNIKVIDILTFNENNEPVFPQKKFNYEGKPCNRIVFEYNERAQMTLEYNISMEKVVFDHLSPSRPSLQGEYQFYGPDFSYDALFFEDGIWMHQTDVQITNE
jgi:hypothetical protein